MWLMILLQKKAPIYFKSLKLSDISSTLLTVTFSEVATEPLGRHVTTFCKETGMWLLLKKKNNNNNNKNSKTHTWVKRI